MVNAIPTIEIEAEEPFEASGQVLDRRAVLRILSRAIEETGNRVSGPRFRPREGDSERLQYLRVLVSLASTYGSILTGARNYRLDGLPEPSEEERMLEAMIRGEAYSSPAPRRRK
jgi:hypothetical protein